MLAVAAVLADLAMDSLGPQEHGHNPAQVQALTAYREAYNMTERIIDMHDAYIISRWGSEWRNAFGTQAPSRTKHLFAVIKTLSSMVDLEAARHAVAQVLQKRSATV